MSKHIKNLSSRNDIAGDKILSSHKWREESSCKVEKNKSTSVKENGSSRSDHKSSHKIDSHGETKVKHHQKESLSKESKTSNHHKKSSKAPKKYESDNSTENLFSEPFVLYTPTRKDLLKPISYDPHLELVEGYNPNQPDLFPKSLKKDCNTYEPDQFYSSKSTKRDCGTYEPSVKRKLEVQTETVSESKPKKLKFVQSSEKMEKHKKHSVQGSKSEKEASFSQKKENSDNSSNDCSKEKSANKSNSSKSDKKSKKSHKKAKLKINSTVEFTSSEANFEDCLGLNDIVIKKKKSSKPVQNATKTQSKVATINSKQSSSHSVHPATPPKSSSVQTEKSRIIVPKSEKVTAKIEDVNIMSTLPQTLPNYRPLPRVDLHSKKKEVLSNEDAFVFMSSKREKTAVYSGRRSYYTEVPSLFEICSRSLIDNIDYLEYTGGVSFIILKPVLEKLNPQQLLHVENYNPYLLEDTDELWELHCKRECKLHKLEENETYRELYLRAQDERERKLKSITAHISSSMSKYNPARQVKLAYVDSFVKPPRDVARKQAKNGITSTPESQPVKASLPSKTTPKPVTPGVKPASSAPHASNQVIKTKPKVAPLMAKTLKSMKLCFRR